MPGNCKIKTILSGFFILIIIMGMIGLSLLTTHTSQASGPKIFNETMGSLCGKLIFLTEEKTGAIRLGLRPCTDAEKVYVFSQNPADLYNVYQFKNVEIESGEPFQSKEYGKLKQYITGWDSYVQLASCSDCNKGIPVIPTATITPTAEIVTETQLPVIQDTPTPTPTPFNVSLAITNFEAEPGNPVLKQRFVLRLTVENHGDALEAPAWAYTGQISLKDNNGVEVETYSFSEGRFSSIAQAVENGQPVMNKWIITIPVSFRNEVNNGRLSVSLQPKDYPLKPAISDNRSCALAVSGKLGTMFSEDPSLKTAWEGETASIAGGNCGAEDVGCYTTPLVRAWVKTLLMAYPDIQQNAWSSHSTLMSRLIDGIAGLFDVEALQVCQQPQQWLWGLVKELNRYGLAINLLGINSPAIMKISNAQGGITGVLINGELVNQIPDSRAFQWDYETFILYPPQEVLITLQGIDSGTFNLEGVIGKGSERVNVFYENISVVDGSTAVLNTADTTAALQIDANGDGQTDTTLQASRLEVIPLEAIQAEQTSGATTPETQQPFKLPCANAPAVALPLIGIWLLRRKNCG